MNGIWLTLKEYHEATDLGISHRRLQQIAAADELPMPVRRASLPGKRKDTYMVYVTDLRTQHNHRVNSHLLQLQKNNGNTSPDPKCPPRKPQVSISISPTSPLEIILRNKPYREFILSCMQMLAQRSPLSKPHIMPPQAKHQHKIPITQEIRSYLKAIAAEYNISTASAFTVVCAQIMMDHPSLVEHLATASGAGINKYGIEMRE